MIDYAAVLTAQYPDAEWSLIGTDYSGLTWLSATPMPSKESLEAAWPSVRDALGWESVRRERDRLLAASDWTMVSDTPLTETLARAWADYRQDLRDVPQQFASPEEVVWPSPPS